MTDDLFKPSTNQSRAVFNAAKAFDKEIEWHDTFEMSEIYMQRPASLICMSFGLWFCKAHGLQDWTLLNTAGANNCKRIIVEKGYNRLSLEPLKQFNTANK